MSNWAVISRGGTDVEGSDTSTSLATSITSDTSGGGPTWVEIAASTPYAFDGVTLIVNGQPNVRLCVDIGIGASGSEQALISDIMVFKASTTPGLQMFIPLSVPAGVRLCAAVTTNGTTAVTANVQIIGHQRTGLQPRYPMKYTTYNVSRTNCASSTTVAASATVNTKGTWAQLTSSSIAARAILLNIGTGTGNTNSASHLLDIGFGASGSETVVASNIALQQFNNGTHMVVPMMLISLTVPASTRIAVRNQCNSTTNVVRTLNPSIHLGN